MSLVTIVTASTGRSSLNKCIQSVANQRTFSPGKIQHLIFADGPYAYSKIKDIQDAVSFQYIDIDVINLPEAVGEDRFNGHRIYGAATFLTNSEYIMFLDDDVTIDSNHVEACLQSIKSGPYGWAYSLRKIVDQSGNFICNDDCESLGPDHPTILAQNDHLVDVNCYFIHRELAVYTSPIWYRKAREPGVMEVDRALCMILNGQSKAKGVGTGKYSVNYAVDSNALSVSSNFFIKGNEEMKKRYPNGFPWSK